jgi:hypothetical protein
MIMSESIRKDFPDWENLYKSQRVETIPWYNETKGAAEAVWNKMKSGNIRDCIKVGRMSKSLEDVNFIVDTFSMVWVALV